jgi:hypothetical protein
MSQSPENTILRSDYDASIVGLYASLVAGGLMLAYAIYYVTVVNVSDDYSFLTLGIITGATALSVFGMHEWFRYQHGAERVENPIEEYGGAIAVLMGSLSAVWLSRFAVFYAGPEEMGWIENGYQEGDVWMPVWLAALQTVAILLVMEVSTRSIRRHSLGTLPRTVVVIAPLAVVFSGVKIWLEYSRGELEWFITLSVVLLTGSAVLYSLRLDRAVLYLLSSGAAVGLPIFMSLSSWGETEHASLLVPAVVLVGITATDRSLSKRMIENGSGAVVAAVLFCQIIAADETQFVIAGQTISQHPFGLTFWLWVALLVGWFAATTMQRTPAMPVGLALALALLSDEAAMVAWFVGISAFVYLETRPQARDWVVRATYVAMVVSWTVSSFIGASREGNIIEIGGFSLGIVDGLSLVLFPAVLALGIWAQLRGRLRFYEGPSVLLLLASFNVDLIEEAHLLFVVIISISVLYQMNSFLRLRTERDDGLLNWGTEFAYLTLMVSPLALSIFFSSFETIEQDVVARGLPLIAAVSLFTVCHRWRIANESLSLRPEMAVMLFLILVFLMLNIEVTPAESVRLTLACSALSVALLAFEGGAAFRTTPLERLVGISYLSIVSLITALIMAFEDADVLARSARDLLIISAPALVNFRLKTLVDLSQEARNFGTLTLLVLLMIGMTDSSGGLLAIPVFGIAVQRAAKHVSTPILASLPVFAILYASFFEWSHDPEGDILWPLMSGLSYLGDTTDMLSFDTPRWASILLFSIPAVVAFYLPSEREREDGSRYGPEQLFGPALALLLAFAFLLPDTRTAPIMIVAVLSFGAWKKGVVQWFWVSPIAWFWASSQLIEYINWGSGVDSSGAIDPHFAQVIGGLSGLIQYILYEKGVLLQNSHRDESLDQRTYDYLGSASRGYGYVFFLFSGGITGALPFLAALIAGWDGLRNGIPMMLHCSVFVQAVTLWFWVDGDFGIHPDNALLWPIIAGLAMVYLSWSGKDPYGSDIKAMVTVLPEQSEGDSFDMEKNFGLFGSAFFLVAMLPYSGYIELEFVFGLSIVVISLHHVVVGFSRDHGWRRMISLVGMPSGLIYTGYEKDGLTLVVMLFLAALTLIGQAVLYASRGGLEIGSTIEGAKPFVSEVGVPDSESGEKPSDERDIPERESSELPDDHDAARQEEEEAPFKPKTVETRKPSPLFASNEAPFGIRLDPPLVSNLRAMIVANNSVDFSKWSPVLGISANGAIVLNWEKTGIEEE